MIAILDIIKSVLAIVLLLLKKRAANDAIKKEKIGEIEKKIAAPGKRDWTDIFERINRL